MTIVEFGILATLSVNTVFGVCGLVISWGNRTRLAEVHKSTNGLSERNEAIARKLGIEEGKATEKAHPT
jgi:hypothetical protein